VIDASQLTTNQSIITFVEEAFSIYEVIDMSESLFEKGYVGSYNQPKSEEIWRKLGY
jgi:hypothetical protein